MLDVMKRKEGLMCSLRCRHVGVIAAEVLCPGKSGDCLVILVKGLTGVIPGRVPKI